MSKTKSYLLPAGRRSDLKKAAAKGLDNFSSPETEVVQDVYHAIAGSLQKEIKKRGLNELSLVRRQWWLVHQLNSALAGDGSVGLMYNQPELINAGIEGLASLKLPHTMKLLKYAKSIIPKEFDPDKRGKKYLAWVEEGMPAEQAEQLDALCEKAEPYTKGSLQFSTKLALKHPSEFFEAE
ncbi:MAG: hypothetical protein QM783_05475 [Phycisphaerales bacterium]